jgi:hypothetical protein
MPNRNLNRRTVLATLAGSLVMAARSAVAQTPARQSLDLEVPVPPHRFESVACGT